MADQRGATCVATDFSEELQCALCLDAWRNPVELRPCRHIFCRACYADIGATTCPVCRQTVDSETIPHRVLVNMSLQVPVKCSACGWMGTRERAAGLTCDAAAQAAKAPAGSSMDVSHADSVRPSVASASAKQDDYRVYCENDDSGYTSRLSAAARFGLLEDEYDQMMSLFLFFAEMNGEELTRSEALRFLSWLNFASDPQSIDAIFAQIDTDRSGTISLDELLLWMMHHEPNPTALYGLTRMEYHNTMMQFRLNDTDQNGYLDPAEFTRMCLRLGEVSSPSEASRLFYEIDTDHNGFVDLSEFLLYRARHRSGSRFRHEL